MRKGPRCKNKRLSKIVVANSVQRGDELSEDEEAGGEASGEALERIADKAAEQVGPVAGDGRGVPGTRIRPEVAAREMQELSQRLDVVGDKRITPKTPENPRESFNDALEKARAALDDGSDSDIEKERLRHASQLESLDLAARLSASITYGTDSWDAVGAEIATSFWGEVKEHVDSVYSSLAVSLDGPLPESFEPRATAAQESAIWWMKKCGSLTVLQFVTAMALGYGRPEEEIKEVLDVNRHEIMFWMEEFPDFREMREFWRRRWEERAERHEQSTIDSFMAHADPKLQGQGVSMINQRTRTKDTLRKTVIQETAVDIQRDRAELDRKRTENEERSPRARAEVRILIDAGQLLKKGHVADQGQLPPSREADYIEVEPDEAEDILPDE